MKQSNYTQLMERSLRGMYREALGISLKNPGLAFYILRTVFRQKRLAALRQEMESQGVRVPPYMIVSITGRCNLSCKGCYAMAKKSKRGSEMGMDRLKGLMQEASELGVSIFILAGGEPLVRKEVLDATGGFPELVFPLFTNGMLMTDEVIDKIRRQKNVVPVISIEGHEGETDGRRGEGVWRNAGELMQKLRKKGIFFGTSITVTRANFDTVTDKSFVDGLSAAGCRLFFYVEYVPFKEGTEDWVPTQSQREKLGEVMDSFRSRMPALFIAFPGDEKEYGGCVSSGRGFVHVSSDGDLEPCPFAPFSDVNLKDTALKDALRSRLLEALRQNPESLDETEGGCSLWKRRAWVESLQKNGTGG